eukprot:1146885-Pelagomonas_calceolata.AAC.2
MEEFRERVYVHVYEAKFNTTSLSKQRCTAIFSALLQAVYGHNRNNSFIHVLFLHNTIHDISIFTMSHYAA